MMNISSLWSPKSDEPSVGDYGVYIKTTSTAIKVQPGKIVDIAADGRIRFERNLDGNGPQDGVKSYDWYTNHANLPYQKDGGILAPYSMYENHNNIHKDDLDLTFRTLRFGNEALVPTSRGFATCSHDDLREVQAARAKSASAYNLGGSLGEDRVIMCMDCETIRV